MDGNGKGDEECAAEEENLVTGEMPASEAHGDEEDEERRQGADHHRLSKRSRRSEHGGEDWRTGRSEGEIAGLRSKAKSGARWSRWRRRRHRVIAMEQRKLVRRLF